MMSFLKEREVHPVCSLCQADSGPPDQHQWLMGSGGIYCFIPVAPMGGLGELRERVGICRTALLFMPKHDASRERELSHTNCRLRFGATIRLFHSFMSSYFYGVLNFNLDVQLY